MLLRGNVGNLVKRGQAVSLRAESDCARIYVSLAVEAPVLVLVKEHRDGANLLSLRHGVHKSDYAIVCHRRACWTQSSASIIFVPFLRLVVGIALAIAGLMFHPWRIHAGFALIMSAAMPELMAVAWLVP